MFFNKKKDNDYLSERFERTERKNYDWQDEEEREYRKFMRNCIITVITFAILGILGLTALDMYLDSRPNPYDIAFESEAAESPTEVEEPVKESDPELSYYTMENLTKSVNYYRAQLPKIKLQPMVDGTSAEFRQDFKELPMENLYSNEVSKNLKEENIGTYDLKELTKKLYEIDFNDRKQYKKLAKPIVTKPSDEDIERLKSYECYKLTYDGKISANYKSFEEKYEKDRKDAEYIYKKFHPASVYANVQVFWNSSPKLVYDTPLGQRAIRGVIGFRYYHDEKTRYKLKVLKRYERDVEFRLKFTTDGNFLNKIIYLSDWREAK